MSEKPVCRRCGYVGPADARFCANCGRSLVPLNVRFSRSVNRTLSNLSPLHIGLINLVLLGLISVFADRLIVIELSFPLSLVPLSLIIGCGCATLGWHWSAQLPSRGNFVRMLLVFVCLAGCLVAIWLIDMRFLSFVTDRADMVVYNIPGVYRESTAEIRRMSIDAGDLSYGLVVMLYGLLTAAAGHLVQGAYKCRLI